ncbi:hypothetical protein ACEE18_09780 [Corynebacterium freneyi]
MPIKFHGNSDSAVFDQIVVDSNVLEQVHGFVNAVKRGRPEFRDLAGIYGKLEISDTSVLDSASNVVWNLALTERCFTRVRGFDSSRLDQYLASARVFNSLSSLKFERYLEGGRAPGHCIEPYGKSDIEALEALDYPGFALHYAYALKILSQIWGRYGAASPRTYIDLEMLRSVLKWVDEGVGLFTPMPIVWAWGLFQGAGQAASRAEAFAKLRKSPLSSPDDVANRAWNIAWDFNYFRFRDELAAQGSRVAVATFDKDSKDIASSYSIRALVYMRDPGWGSMHLPISEMNPEVIDPDVFEFEMGDLLSEEKVVKRISKSWGREELEFLRPVIAGLETDLGCAPTYGI